MDSSNESKNQINKETPSNSKKIKQRLTTALIVVPFLILCLRIQILGIILLITVNAMSYVEFRTLVSRIFEDLSNDYCSNIVWKTILYSPVSIITYSIMPILFLIIKEGNESNILYLPFVLLTTWKIYKFTKIYHSIELIL